ncbi:MAG: NDP-sugar synthase [Candidatus Bathyarchaeia archaeon]|nr:NDP-sugar synthase [Candidatus Bathyarchaeota archaeon]
MKALILAGGYGTRLRPLSCRKPKLLFPILGKPILKWNMEVLAEMGVSEVVLALNYLADILTGEMGRSYHGIRIRYTVERTPLGTGGPIKRAMRILGGEEVFLAMNGDVVFDRSMGGVLEAHMGSGAVATIALREVEDTSRFGVALVDREGWIRGFVEKPKPGTVDSNLINAGFYALSRGIFKYIPSGRKVSTEREVFPVLAREKRLRAFIYRGYWSDIGEIEDFIRVNRRFLEALPGDGVSIDEGASVEGGVEVNPPVKICRAVHVEDGASLGPYTVVGEGCRIGRGSRISNSILFEGCRIGERASIDGGVLGDRVSIGAKAKIMSGTVLGEEVSIMDGIRIMGGTSICPYKEVRDDVLTPGKVM